MLNYIDANTLKKMFLAGTKNLDSKKEWINDLNVFPVPDGDTGTNMTLTLMSAVKELNALGDNASIDEVGKKIASGTLKGARGNSGVIMSQLCRGFVKEIEGAEKIDIDILVSAFDRAQVTAYKAVMKPKEGTILTVANAISRKAAEAAVEEGISLNDFFCIIIQNAEEVLKATPDMLPVLKEAGVVDSGGQGLLEFIKGAYDAYSGKEIDVDFSGIESNAPSKVSAHISAGTSRAKRTETQSGGVRGKKTDVSALETSDIKFGYCTEFIINIEKRFNSRDEANFKKYLSNAGDSIVCVCMDDIVKVHVHTNDPGLVIQKGLSYGSLSNIKIDNMREEHNERLFAQEEYDVTGSDEAAPAVKEGEFEPVPEVAETVAAITENPVTETEPEETGDVSAAVQTEEPVERIVNLPKKEYGFVAVCSGDGLKNVFKNMSVDEVIEGGQTMNPSTDDILSVVGKVNADNIFVLPNNSNIIMAAEQAARLSNDRNIIVIPTKTVAQGITAVINYVPAMNIEENAAHMTAAIKEIKTAEITYAVRDTTINEQQIKKGDYMAIGDTGILAVGENTEEVAFDAVSAMFDEDSEIVTIYYGADADENLAGQLAEKIEEVFDDAEVDVVYGGQPIYNYIVSVE